MTCHLHQTPWRQFNYIHDTKIFIILAITVVWQLYYSFLYLHMHLVSNQGLLVATSYVVVVYCQRLCNCQSSPNIPHSINNKSNSSIEMLGQCSGTGYLSIFAETIEGTQQVPRMFQKSGKDEFSYSDIYESNTLHSAKGPLYKYIYISQTQPCLAIVDGGPNVGGLITTNCTAALNDKR